MKIIRVQTQKCFDQLPGLYKEPVKIILSETCNGRKPIELNKSIINATIVLSYNSSARNTAIDNLYLEGNATLINMTNCKVYATGHSKITDVSNFSSIYASDFSFVSCGKYCKSFVKLLDDATVECLGPSTVIAYHNSTVIAKSLEVEINYLADSSVLKSPFIKQINISKKSKKAKLLNYEIKNNYNFKNNVEKGLLSINSTHFLYEGVKSVDNILLYTGRTLWDGSTVYVASADNEVALSGSKEEAITSIKNKLKETFLRNESSKNRDVYFKKYNIK